MKEDVEGRVEDGWSRGSGWRVKVGLAALPFGLAVEEKAKSTLGAVRYLAIKTCSSLVGYADEATCITPQ